LLLRSSGLAYFWV